jgi:integrative and conjugative element protein (TIGR02256 family)
MGRVLEIHVPAEVAAFLRENSQSLWPLETGGIVAGYARGGSIHASAAAGPGPAARHSPRGFTRDGEHSQRSLESIVAASRGVADYVGEWHSHPENAGPSGRDRRSMKEIAEDPRYANTRPILILCIRSVDGKWSLRGYVSDRRELREVRVVQAECGGEWTHVVP